MPEAMPTRSRPRPEGKHRNRGVQTGWYLAFARYSDSSCHHFDPTISSARQSRSTGPAPMRSPSSKVLRNTAKFSEMRSTPRTRASWARLVTMNSITPFSAERSRRMRSSDRPSLPQGTNDSSARRRPSPSKHSTRTQLPSLGSPSRDSAIEKPRSVAVSRQASAQAVTSAISCAESWRCRRTRTV